jgi:hypothetical protein
VTYRNQTNTCKWCGERLHYGKTCAENLITPTGSANERLKSYADAFRQNTASTINTVSNENVNDADITNDTQTNNNKINNTSNNYPNSTNTIQNNDTQQNNEILQNPTPEPTTQSAPTSNVQQPTTTHSAHLEKSQLQVADYVRGIFWKKSDDTTSQTEETSEEEMETENDEPEETNTETKNTHENNSQCTSANHFRKTRSSTKIENSYKKPKRDFRQKLNH